MCFKTGLRGRRTKFPAGESVVAVCDGSSNVVCKSSDEAEVFYKELNDKYTINSSSEVYGEYGCEVLPSANMTILLGPGTP